jgi:hypothetical protein
MNVEQPVRGKNTQKQKTVYFDYENEWKIKTFNNNEISYDDPKISSHLENELQIPPLPVPDEASLEAMDYLS